MRSIPVAIGYSAKVPRHEVAAMKNYVNDNVYPLPSRYRKCSNPSLPRGGRLLSGTG
jgi:hypothetical protein